MEVLWNGNYPGIYIEDSAGGVRGAGRQLGMVEGHAFLSLTRQNLNKLASRPIGQDLLTLISKRCRGIGTQLQGGKCTIFYGTGTLTEGQVDFERAVMRETNASSFGVTPGDANRTSIPFVSHGVAMPGLTKVGKGTSAGVAYNPFGSYSDVMIGTRSLRTIIGCDTPAFVALAHELVHAYHRLSGNRKTERPGGRAPREEAWTVGAGQYANTRISENAIRAEWGIQLRAYYSRPGDCA